MLLEPLRQSALPGTACWGDSGPRVRLLERPLCSFRLQTQGSLKLTLWPQILSKERPGSQLRGIRVRGKQVAGEGALQEAVKTRKHLGRTVVESS